MLIFVSLNILVTLHGHLALSAFQSLSCYCNQKVMSSDASQHVFLIHSNSWIVWSSLLQLVYITAIQLHWHQRDNLVHIPWQEYREIQLHYNYLARHTTGHLGLQFFVHQIQNWQGFVPIIGINWWLIQFPVELLALTSEQNESNFTYYIYI